MQRALSDFYVEYTLIVHLESERLRVETLSSLHANIQDAFNEFGVQIMSPHFMMQPQQNIVVDKLATGMPRRRTQNNGSRFRARSNISRLASKCCCFPPFSLIHSENGVPSCQLKLSGVLSTCRNFLSWS